MNQDGAAVRAFHEELRALEGELLRMGAFVEQAVHAAVKSLATRDLDLARRVIAEDDIADKMQVDIENRCLELIALHQPMASDLRVIGTALKIVTDLERIADHAADVARATIRLGNEPLIKPLIDIPRMAETAQQMVKGALDSFVGRSPDMARRLREADDLVDHLYSQVFRELLVYMMEDPSTIRQATSLLMVAQHLERVADHATNIGEWVIYMITGDRCDLND
ncbi:MAG: phosphate signaling complex protein PhoU [Bacillota bacterium]